MKKWIVLLMVGVATPVMAQTPGFVINPTTVVFEASADHATVLEGVAAVNRYELRIYLDGAAAPLTVADLGKPTPVGTTITAQPAALTGVPAFQKFYAKVAAVGPGGEGVSEQSNPFGRLTAPSSPGVPLVDRR